MRPSWGGEGGNRVSDGTALSALLVQMTPPHGVGLASFTAGGLTADWVGTLAAVPVYLSRTPLPDER